MKITDTVAQVLKYKTFNKILPIAPEQSVHEALALMAEYKGRIDVAALRASGSPILLTSPYERALGLELLRFGEALDLAVEDYRPNQLTSYLFDLANRYATFYEHCHVLGAESDDLRNSRLLLCDLTARTLRLGLELLGIEVVDKM